MKSKLSVDARVEASLQKSMLLLARETLKQQRVGTICLKEMLGIIDVMSRHLAFMEGRRPEPEIGAAIDDLRKRLGNARAPSEPAGSR